MNYIIIILFCFLNTLDSKVHYYSWEVKDQDIAVDNFNFEGITINGVYPGPTIEIEQHDQVNILINNQSHRNITIHWHGIEQRNSNNMDGVPELTQARILTNSSFKYQFNVYKQSGTYWYHAHTDLDIQVIYGALIIKEKFLKELIEYNENYYYDEEFTLILSERWHKNTSLIYHDLLNPPFQFPFPSQSILTNGRTFDVWENNTNTKEKDLFNEGYYVKNVDFNKIYRIRIIAANGLSNLIFEIQNHIEFKVIEVDGTLIEPILTNRIELHPAQRYSILVKMNQPINNYYMMTRITGSNSNPLLPNNGVAILHYNGAEPTDKLKKKLYVPERLNLTENLWILPKLKNSQFYRSNCIDVQDTHIYQVPKQIDQEIIINITNGIANNVPKFLINNQLENKDYFIKNNTNIQIILQHFQPIGGNCVTHPWHLHGHSFYVVSNGTLPYDPSTDSIKIQDTILSHKKNLVLQDTFTHFANPRTVGDVVFCGWYAIRLKADNPGKWLSHCHINPHLVMGKSFVLNYN
ncbi:hypothetical protein K502DRAFT_359234 [Neoconidiobolus thromboides FSU 785]|nr:hypothetical protein K502DRAFT_359234 [Neoconidiobolus thromboides FSU 785]